MLTVEEIAVALKDRRIPLLAKATGLHPNTIYAIRDGRVTRPAHKTVKALSDYLTGVTNA